MTILLAFATDDFIFLASDTLRTDLLLPELKLTASKMRVSGSIALVMAGANIDRTAFADQLLAARLKGEPFIDAANRLAPSLFADKRPQLWKLAAHKRGQVVFNIYADVTGDTCSAAIHQIGEPESFALTFKGMLVNQPALEGMSLRIARDCLRHGILELDTWAKQMTALATQVPSLGVGFPLDLALLRKGQDAVERRNILANAPPDALFSVPFLPESLSFEPGALTKFPTRANSFGGPNAGAAARPAP